MPRIVVLGCGTNVGKTRVAVALLEELRRRGHTCLGLKPIESGIETGGLNAEPPTNSDAARLANAGSARPSVQHPLYALRDPVSPHLAARAAAIQLDLQAVARWVATAENAMTPHVMPRGALWTVVETAGGVFSPLSQHTTNFDLGLALEPARWLLVAADALGVLHDVSATHQAMQARGRPHDYLVLSAAREPDLSTGTNAAELASLGIAKPSAVLARDDDRGISPLVDRLLDEEP